MAATTAVPVRTGPATKGNGLLLLGVLGGMFLAMLDQTIVGTALPRITADFGGAGLYTWVVTAYLLTSTVTVPLYGRLSDAYGRKPLLLIGIVVFLLGSVLCGLAQNMGQLIAFRGVQGLGAGALLPLSLALVADLFPPDRSGRVQGAIGAVMAGSYIAGPFLGGFFTDHASWRWAFFVNIPIGAVLLLIIVSRLPRVPGTGGSRPDYAGIAVFTVAISALLLGLTEKGLDGHTWTSAPVIGPLVAAAVLLGVFVLVESRAEQPIIPLHLFRNPTYTIVNITSFFTASCLFAGAVFLPRFFQQAQGQTATSSGLHIYPLMLGMVTGSILTGMLISKTRRYKPWLLAAPFLIIAGALLCSGLAVDTPTWSLVAWMALIGLGIGPMLSGLTVAIQYSVPPSYIGTASANLTFFRQIGGSVALAIAGTAYTSVVGDQAAGHATMAQAHAAAAATVIPWLAVAGAVVALVALVFLPGRVVPALAAGRVAAAD
ncbi:MDR family MFS transporter [Sphaerisporangium corydalis]|uniref:MDR family MFS transporter n=1 Tax=Sphaerisporangium corydalis TaxID=1441875 RepID=A0ABV9EDI4_9ACTN|nr:MDR family MFS transporter [Sphaerisporangium corydalis]